MHITQEGRDKHIAFEMLRKWRKNINCYMERIKCTHNY